jgi:hypothetical protein
VFRSYVSIYRSIERELLRLGLKRSWGAGDNWSPQIEARELFDTFVRDGATAYRQKLAELEASAAKPLGLEQKCNLPPTNEATPVWVLTSTEPSKQVLDYEGDCYHSQDVTIAGLTATTFARCTNSQVDVWSRSNHSWSAAPPERLAPGETLKITSTASVEGTYLSGANLGSGLPATWVSIYLYPGGGPYPGGEWASAGEEGAPSVSAVSEFSIPSGGPGVLMKVFLQVQGPGGSGMMTYTYEWGEPGGP